MQFIQQFLSDQLGRGVFHAVDHPVSHRPDRFETILFFEPIDQEIRCRFVIGGGEFAALLLFPGRVIERQIRPAQADAVNLSIKPSLQRFVGWYSANLMLDEPPLIVRMRGLAAFMGDSFVICNPNEASFAHVDP